MRIVELALFSTLVFALPLSARAEEAQPAPSQAGEARPGPSQASEAQPAPALSRTELTVGLEQAHTLRIMGVALTFSGLGVTVLGTTMAIIGLANFAVGMIFDWDSLGASGSLYVAGFVLALVGAATLVAGVPLWAIGGVRERRLAHQLSGRRLVPLLAVDPARGTALAGLGMTF